MSRSTASDTSRRRGLATGRSRRCPRRPPMFGPRAVHPRYVATDAGDRDIDHLRWEGRPSSRGGLPFEESPDITGQGGRESDPGKPAGKCHRNTPPMARSHVQRAQARVKGRGKSAPASWRHGGQVNPTRCKAKQDRLQAARQGPGRPRQMDGCSTTESGLQVCYGKAPLRRGFSMGTFAGNSTRMHAAGSTGGFYGNRSTRTPGLRRQRSSPPRRCIAGAEADRQACR